MNENNVQETVNLPTIQKKKKKSGFLRFLLTLFILVGMVALFLFGVIIGGQFGDGFTLIDPNDFPVPEYIVDGLRKAGKVDILFDITEDDINSLLVANEEQFKPLKNLYISLEDGYAVLSGQVEAESLKEIAGVAVPDIIWLFLPSVLNLKAEITVTVTDAAPDVDILSLSIINAENGEELVLVSGFDHIFQELIDDVVEEAFPETVSIKEINILEDKVRIKLATSLIKDE